MKKVLKCVAYALGAIIWVCQLIGQIYFVSTTWNYFVTASSLFNATIALFCDFSIVCFCVVRFITILLDILSSNEKMKAHREARAAAHAQKVEADKQRRIEELQSELEELKKDE